MDLWRTEPRLRNFFG